MQGEEIMILYTLVPVGLAIAAAIALGLGLHLDALVSWLIGINVVTFLTYGYDKRIAGSHRTRVPEKVLLLLAFIGGTIGALLGMYLFHHKTAKASFQHKFWLVVLAQIAVAVLYFVWLKPWLQAVFA
jgi:uncharacterized membrane protein YsdA (DUF1294 family)